MKIDDSMIMYIYIIIINHPQNSIPLRLSKTDKLLFHKKSNGILALQYPVKILKLVERR